MYYLKYYNTIVAEVDENSQSMEIVNPDLFFDKFNKNVMSGLEFKDWLMQRCRPQSQKGFSEFLALLRIKESPSMYWEIFVKTRGVNIKDKLWLAFDYDEEFEVVSPWVKLLDYDKTILDIDSLDTIDITIRKTLKQFNIDGACKKDIYRLNGKLVIIKEILQENSYDNISEELVYDISTKLGIECAPAGVLEDFKSFSEIDETKDLEHASKVFNLDSGSFEDVCVKMNKLRLNRAVKINILRMGILDLLTRQMDRNLTNFSFYKVNANYQMYRLYDNGLSLFSTVRFNPNLEYNLGFGETSLTKLRRICFELKRLGTVQLFPTRLTYTFLENITKPYKDIIYKKNGNKIEDVINWILRMQELIESELIKQDIVYSVDGLSTSVIPKEKQIGMSDSEIIKNYLISLANKGQINKMNMF